MSLSSQTFRDWVAIVIDDSPYKEGEEVVSEFVDKRIHYVHNLRHFGAAGNLDQAFNSSALLKGDFALVLEDDNALMPTFISSNIQIMDSRNVSILMRNQVVYEQIDDAWNFTSNTTKSRLYEDGVIYKPIQVHATLFLSDCIANGGLFWRTDAIKTNFQVGSSVLDAGVQEYCRTIQIDDELLFAADPLAIFTRMKSYRNVRSRLADREFGRCIQSLRRKLIAKYGNTIVEVAQEIAERRGCETKLHSALVESLYLPEVVRSLSCGRHSGLLLKAALKRVAVCDGIKGYVVQ